MDEKSPYTVSEKTISETKRCKKGFSCLTGQREDLCEVESCVNGEVLFMKCINDEFCPYHGSFGNNVICYCPTRKELYNKYGV